MLEVDTIQCLDPIYKRLFRLIAQLRPSLTGEFLRIRHEIESGTWDLDRDCSLAEGEIVSTMNAVKHTFHWADDTVEDPAIRLQILMSAFRLLYSHSNYWYTLVDGVAFEGLLETKALIVTNKCSEIIGLSVAETLTDLIEPLTTFQYSEIPSARVEKAKAHHNTILERNGEVGKDLESFLYMYSRAKEHEQMFNKLMTDYFERVIPFARNKICALISEMELPEPDDDDLRPWNFFAFWDDKVLPALLRKKESK